MRSQRMFMILTLASLAVTAGAIAERVLSQSEKPTGHKGQFVWDEYLNEEATKLAGTSFVTGISQTVPSLAAIPRVDSIPWKRKDVADLFERVGNYASCEVLPSDVQVEEPLSRVPEGSSGPLGRYSMFSIGLQMDPDAEDSLPAATDGAIKSYLRDHLLTVQAPLYRYPDGTVFFGNKMRAAFYAKTDPKRTLTPEPVISSAIGRFRTLGVYAPSSNLEGTDSSNGDEDGSVAEPSEAELRTLILGFKYIVDFPSADPNTTTERRPEFELLFLHLLPDHTAENPSVTVFATSNGRTILHELDLAHETQVSDDDSALQLPEITADIRFEDFTMMGLYPTNPVVTGVSHNARQSLPTEIVRGLMLGLTHDKPETLTAILDQLHAKGGDSGTKSNKL